MNKLTEDQHKIVELGRFMIDMSEKGGYSDQILNALSRVGEQLTEQASFKDLSPADQLVIKFAMGKM